MWQVHETSFGLSGDLIFVKGAHACSFDLPVGNHHSFRGARPDSHDAIGIELRAVVEYDQASSPKRIRTADAPQLVRNDAAASQLARLGGDALDLPAAKAWMTNSSDCAAHVVVGDLTGDASQVAQDAASASGASRLGDDVLHAVAVDVSEARVTTEVAPPPASALRNAPQRGGEEEDAQREGEDEENAENSMLDLRVRDLRVWDDLGVWDDPNVSAAMVACTRLEHALSLAVGQQVDARQTSEGLRRICEQQALMAEVQSLTTPGLDAVPECKRGGAEGWRSIGHRLRRTPEGDRPILRQAPRRFSSDCRGRSNN